MIFLASTSPRRRHLLWKMNIPVRVVPTRYRERPGRPGRPAATAMRHARGKAEGAVVPRRAGLVLGVDTLIYFRKRIFGKPRSRAHAFRMLKSFSGRSHDVYSAIALVDLKTRRTSVRWTKTRVTFNRLDDKTIGRYLARVNPLDKAGGYAIQHGQELIRDIRGSYTNVMGLPAELLKRELRKFNVTVAGEKRS
ncbi:MAG: septum formation protein Maf [Candidatus Lindowbacteria bacterium RIFCSPLOWO2_12_FULL_62_27]|nr:MAG: septum formation protein Maf [Candidatus Lindowbacteria bacterium RIFCSPLOWO2_12_FULL_62_27]OGH62955.1 MAG: septum formation protein Maf [Candidatus Lindowbacteria bacterium RIFCSPLOWO2_02_FULL_62_12]